MEETQNKRFTKLYDEDFDLLFDDQWAFRLYLYLIRHATHREYEYNGMLLQPGHYVRSVSKLVDDIAYYERNKLKKPGRATINRAIKKLESLGLIETEYPIKSVFNDDEEIGTENGTDLRTEVGTLFTVVKMQTYQGIEENPNNEVGTENGTENGTEVGSKSIFNKQDLYKQELINKDIDNRCPVSDERKLDVVSEILLSDYVGYGFERTEFVERRIQKWIDSGISPAVIKEVISRANDYELKKGKLENPLAYIQYILNDFHGKGFDSVEDFEEYDLDFYREEYTG